MSLYPLYFHDPNIYYFHGVTGLKLIAKNAESNLVTDVKKIRIPKTSTLLSSWSWPHLAPLRIYQEHRVSRVRFDKLVPSRNSFCARLPGLTDTRTHARIHIHRAEKKEPEESSVVFVVPENPPLSSKVRCRFFRCRNGGPHVPTSWNETRKRWEVGGVARSCLGSLLSGERVRRLRRRWIRGYKAEAAVNH